ncbi:hypothetical protein KIS4809_2347 [Bacillus sp. ZZV12-4809]|nr:hypothetical protein KIS4809_2347 [Bacillus sp. ZZV12-4809]
MQYKDFCKRFHRGGTLLIDKNSISLMEETTRKMANLIVIKNGLQKIGNWQEYDFKNLVDR